MYTSQLPSNENSTTSLSCISTMKALTFNRSWSESTIHPFDWTICHILMRYVQSLLLFISTPLNYISKKPSTCLKCRVFVHSLLEYMARHEELAGSDQRLEAVLNALCTHLTPLSPAECQGYSSTYRVSVVVCQQRYSRGITLTRACITEFTVTVLPVEPYLS